MHRGIITIILSFNNDKNCQVLQITKNQKEALETSTKKDKLFKVERICYKKFIYIYSVL